MRAGHLTFTQIWTAANRIKKVSKSIRPESIVPVNANFWFGSTSMIVADFKSTALRRQDGESKDFKISESWVAVLE